MLSPYRVLDLTDERGQFAAFLLGRLGAEVVLVEPPGGSPARHRGLPAPDGSAPTLSFRAVNWGKRSVEADLRTAAGRAVVGDLARGSDIVIESGTPGELDRLGLGYAQLSAANPALIHVSISPFGSSGPKAGWAATDLTVWAAAGPMAITGDADRPPLRLSLPQSFLHAGSQAAAGALLALAERARSGLGQHVDLSAQVACSQATQSATLTAPARAGHVARSGGGIKGGDIFLRFVYPAKDGFVSITHVFGVAVGPFTAKLMDWVHEAGFCDQATRDKDWVDYAMALSDGRESLEEFERIKDCVAAFTAAHTKDELAAGALERRLLLAPVATPTDVLASEQFAARDYWLTGTDGLTYPGAWWKGAVLDKPERVEVAEPGADTAAVLAEPARLPAVARTGGAAPSAAGSAELPLAGVKVLDFMWAVAGPAYSRILADFGATVVRVESSTRLDAARAFLPFFDNKVGAENSALFNNMNAGKLGVTLNLSRPEARPVIEDLVRWADVVTESFSPKAMAGWNLGYEKLREWNPGVIMVSSCLMGQTGPLASFAGYGNLAAALTGFNSIVGWPDRDPVGPFGAYTDYASPQFMLMALLAALDHRRRTGEGQRLDVSQAEAALHYLAPALLAASGGGGDWGCHGNDDLELAPHGVYACAPGSGAGTEAWLALACQDDRAWASLADLMGRADLAALPAEQRLARRRELDDVVGAWLADRALAEAEATLQAHGIAAHRVQNSVEMVDDPQLAEVGFYTTVNHSIHGETVVEAPRFHLSRTPGRATAGAPTLGEHVWDVLSGILGYDDERIAELAAAEVFD
ncbi:MAG: CoA transferase, partial [Acidimicrobiia bacterium]|nr:CoA transferase [Acidimicrobiia bacterium]